MRNTSGCDIDGYAVAVDGSNVQVLYSRSADLDQNWALEFAGDSEAKRDLLVQDRGSTFDIQAYQGGDRSPVTRNDLAAAGEVLCHAGRVPHGGEIEFHFDGGAGKGNASPGAAQIGGPYRVLQRDSLDTWIASANQLGLDNLVAQLSSSMGVIPFVGAGISAAFGFPQWGEFFQNAAEGHPQVEEIVGLVESGQYLDAAEILHATSPSALQRRIEHTFSRELAPEELKTGAVSVLPFLAPGPVITTNFDRVLEGAFRAAGRPFEKIIPGLQTDHIVRAIHRNESALLKIHGDCMDSTFRTFSKWEYDRRYAPDDMRQPNLSSLAWLMFTNRPLLFVGCSLDRDRIVDVLAEIHKKLEALTHYAIVSAPYEVPRREKRMQALDRCGICPIWFRPRQFEAVHDLIALAVQRSASRPLRRPAAVKKVSAPPPAGEAALSAFGNVVSPEQKGGPGEIAQAVYEQIASAAAANKVVYFLGAYAHLGALPLGNQFYSDLADKYHCPDLKWDRAAVARYILDRYGAEALWREMSAVLSTAHISPSLIYRFLAALPGFLRATLRSDASPVILTTNYDTVLERVFAAANEPFHLLYYQGVGEYEGLFIHRSPGGALAQLTRPANILQLAESGSVIVKMDGGLAWDPGIPESVLIARGDFERLAGRLPGPLPAFLLSALRQRSLLFLGHGLAEPDVERLVRLSHGDARETKSWAVQIPGRAPGWVEYWKTCGLEILQEDLSSVYEQAS